MQSNQKLTPFRVYEMLYIMDYSGDSALLDSFEDVDIVDQLEVLNRYGKFEMWSDVGFVEELELSGD